MAAIHNISPLPSRSGTPAPILTSDDTSLDMGDQGPLISRHRPQGSIGENPFRNRESVAPLLSDAGDHHPSQASSGRYISRVGGPPLTQHHTEDMAVDWHSMDSRMKQRLILSYAADWALCIVLAGLFEALNFIPGYQREFSLTETSIQHTFATKERVPVWMLFSIAFGGPFILMPVINLLTVRSWWDLHNSYLGLALGLSLTASLTEVVKVTVGRPRPDLIDRCQPLPGSVDHPIYGLSNVSICTQTNAHILKDGFKSFFSGHSSFSFAGLGFLSLYIAGKLHLFDKRGHSGKAWLAFAPLVGAALIAISRTMDNRHHWQDVLTGSAVGLTLTFFSYRQFYPKLSAVSSHLPHAPRTFGPPRPPVPGSHAHASVLGRYSDLESGGSMELRRTTPPTDQSLLHP